MLVNPGKHCLVHQAALCWTAVCRPSSELINLVHLDVAYQRDQFEICGLQGRWTYGATCSNLATGKGLTMKIFFKKRVCVGTGGGEGGGGE